MTFFSFVQSKKKFERECKEAEKSQVTFERLDNDINATKSDVEKVRAFFWSTPAVNLQLSTRVINSPQLPRFIICNSSSMFKYCRIEKTSYLQTRENKPTLL